jgi:hypothetical protein
MIRKKRVKRVVGDVVAIPLNENHDFGLGVVLAEPLMGFFHTSFKTGQEPAMTEVLRLSMAFRIWVMRQPVVDGTWPVLGKIEVLPEWASKPRFFKEDPINRKVTIYSKGVERLPEPGEVDDLECAAVWSACHVVDRLNDLLAGRPNKWVQSMRPKEINPLTKIPNRW